MQSDDNGFTLIELLVVIGLSGVLLTLGAFALRHYWLLQSVEGAADGLVTELRELQQRAVAESSPASYGARFTQGSSDWQLVEYDISTGSCTTIGNRSFNTGVVVSQADFVDYESSGTNVTNLCLESGSDIVFFEARGSATRGDVTVTQPILDRSRRLCVTAITGRVARC